MVSGSDALGRSALRRASKDGIEDHRISRSKDLPGARKHRLIDFERCIFRVVFGTKPFGFADPEQDFAFDIAADVDGAGLRLENDAERSAKRRFAGP